MPKLQQMNSGNYFITLPKQIIRAKQWQKGREVKVEIDNQGNMVLK